MKEEYLSILSRSGLEKGPYPAIVVGNSVLQGKSDIEKNLKIIIDSVVSTRKE